MKITREMIHPQLRMTGTLMKLIFPCFTEKTFRRITKMMSGMKGRHPKDMHYSQEIIQTGENPSLRVCIYQPLEKQATPKPGILWIHGGGYGLGIPEQDAGFIKEFVKYGCTVIAPDYRVSVIAPYPAALNDCYTALLWMKEHGAEYNINSDQLMVGGDSAGGGLTAAVCIYARDHHEVSIAFQMPLYPMLDDRMTTSSSRNNDAPVWNTKSNENGWKLYLGGLYQTDKVSPYAAPARLKDFSHLPPAFTYVGTIEPFHDETVRFFAQLKQAGIWSVCREYKGCFHAFDLMAPKSAPAKDARKQLNKAFLYAAGHFYIAQP